MPSLELSRVSHTLQNIQLLFLSFFFLPLNTFILCVSYAVRIVFSCQATSHRARVRSKYSRRFKPRNVLITGVGLTQGLALARLFYIAGHNVVGADFEPYFLPFPLTSGHVSRSIKRFYRLKKPDSSSSGSIKYAKSLVKIVRKEEIDIWVSCSGVANAVEDGQAKQSIEQLTDCRCVQYDASTVRLLREKHAFIDHVASIGMKTPTTHTVTSRAAALKLLNDAQRSREKYVIKSMSTGGDFGCRDVTPLPFAVPARTKAYISRLQISEAQPWVLQQYINGPEYCTHALVVRGQVKTFIACPLTELHIHYRVLPEDSSLSRSMLRFTQEIAASDDSNFTGHLSFNFKVDIKEKEAADKDPHRVVALYPMECNPSPHAAVCLFNDTPEMVDCYMSSLKPPTPKKHKGTNGNASHQPVYPRSPSNYYWIGYDFTHFVLLPLRSLFSLHGMSFGEVFDSLCTFIEHVLFWRDASFEVWDPLPAWWLYHVHWPYQLSISLITGKTWSRADAGKSNTMLTY